MRPIDADALSEKIEALMNRYAAQGRTEVAEDYNFVLTVLMTAETIDPESLRPKGRWSEQENQMYYEAMKEDVIWFSHICSVCSFEAMSNFHYCPNCGARMEG